MFVKSINFLAIAATAVAFTLTSSASHVDNQALNAVVTSRTGTTVTLKNGNALHTRFTSGSLVTRDCSTPNMSKPYYVFFAHDSSALDATARATIKEAYETALMHRAVKFKVSGHASIAGKADYNLKLSGRRAAAVDSELQKLGAEASKIATASFGETIPYYRQSRQPNAQKDRRVEVRFVYKK